MKFISVLLLSLVSVVFTGCDKLSQITGPSTSSPYHDPVLIDEDGNEYDQLVRHFSTGGTAPRTVIWNGVLEDWNDRDLIAVIYVAGTPRRRLQITLDAANQADLVIAIQTRSEAKSKKFRFKTDIRGLEDGPTLIGSLIEIR